jgi:hypothetical protein
MVDLASDSPDPLRRAAQLRARSRALREEVAGAAEAVARVEQEVARVHWILAAQGGPLADEARKHAEWAEAVAAKEWAEAERLRRADPPAVPGGLVDDPTGREC